MILLGVMLGGALGALGRWQIDKQITARRQGRIPYGTLAVNMIGSFLLGMVTGLDSLWLKAFLGSGLCGALTTYSTFAVQGVQLLRRRLTTLHVAIHLVVGLAMAALGMLITR